MLSLRPLLAAILCARIAQAALRNHHDVKGASHDVKAARSSVAYHSCSLRCVPSIIHINVHLLLVMHAARQGSYCLPVLALSTSGPWSDPRQPTVVALTAS